jgi:hypothetical protein
MPIKKQTGLVKRRGTGKDTLKNQEVNKEEDLL